MDLTKPIYKATRGDVLDALELIANATTDARGVYEIVTTKPISDAVAELGIDPHDKTKAIRHRRGGHPNSPGEETGHYMMLPEFVATLNGKSRDDLEAMLPAIVTFNQITKETDAISNKIEAKLETLDSPEKVRLLDYLTSLTNYFQPPFPNPGSENVLLHHNAEKTLLLAMTVEHLGIEGGADLLNEAKANYVNAQRSAFDMRLFGASERLTESSESMKQYYLQPFSEIIREDLRIAALPESEFLRRNALEGETLQEAVKAAISIARENGRDAMIDFDGLPIKVHSKSKEAMVLKECQAALSSAPKGQGNDNMSDLNARKLDGRVRP